VFHRAVEARKSFVRLGDVVEDRFDMFLEFREVPVYCCPHFFGINARIVVDQNVTHGHDLRPWDLGMDDLEGV